MQIFNEKKLSLKSIFQLNVSCSFISVYIIEELNTFIFYSYQDVAMVAGVQSKCAINFIWIRFFALVFGCMCNI